MRLIAFVSFLLAALSCLPLSADAFCGFYVAQANAELFNNSSEVIFARRGNYSAITMGSDYEGPLEEFAMVVPVPQVLERQDIKLLESKLFDRFDKYSGPRIVEYHDDSPCYEPQYFTADAWGNAPTTSDGRASSYARSAEREQVKVEAEYQVGEYDILILSAKESGGLVRWLKSHEYHLPKGASEVLTPYIRDQMKFFVVKVNLEKAAQRQEKELRPLRISFQSERFMLPIRLGMANSPGTQDLQIYLLTQNGRVECSNYPTREMPANFKVPQALKNSQKFNAFYKNLFAKTYEKRNRQFVGIEYAWDLSSANFFGCDPCAATPPKLAELQKAGVNWLELPETKRRGGASYQGELFFTRLHLRYDRQHFPQDLQFTETGNTENFQCRYEVHNPVRFNKMDCEDGLAYARKLLERRQEEVSNLETHAGASKKSYDQYLSQAKGYVEKLETKYAKPKQKDPDKGMALEWPGTWAAGLAALALMGIFLWLRFRASNLRR